ncbi:substrate-binding periplasmic protein [Desulfovibrio oxyclinae]|uniref:substrate-binding periplasmic protein n=1 Tax=Desulfovibrio oxyclinae TaxID=63560 RepID=UPI00036AC8B0|nr:transporter substrate-binding domain-containing protein [Desulfovibrio oxyclinae]
MNRAAIFVLIVLAAAGMFMSAAQGMAAPLKKTVRACDDISEWPPYVFYEREGEEAGTLVGMSVDVLEEILDAQGMKLEVSLMPWNQCLERTRKGDVDVVLNAAYSPKRASEFLLSETFYLTTPIILYSTHRYPLGPYIKSLEDLHSMKGCGVSDFGYHQYQIPPERLDTSSGTIVQAVKKLLQQRCDYIPIAYEPYAAYVLTGIDILSDPALGHAPIPGMPKTPYHMLLPRTPRGEKLRAIIDEGLRRMKSEGRLQQLLDEYGIR